MNAIGYCCGNILVIQFPANRDLATFSITCGFRGKAVRCAMHVQISDLFQVARPNVVVDRKLKNLCGAVAVCLCTATMSNVCIIEICSCRLIMAHHVI